MRHIEDSKYMKNIRLSPHILMAAKDNWLFKARIKHLTFSFHSIVSCYGQITWWPEKGYTLTYAHLGSLHICCCIGCHTKNWGSMKKMETVQILSSKSLYFYKIIITCPNLLKISYNGGMQWEGTCFISNFCMETPPKEGKGGKSILSSLCRLLKNRALIVPTQSLPTLWKQIYYLISCPD